MAVEINGLNILMGNNPNEGALTRGAIVFESAMAGQPELFPQAWECYNGVYKSKSASKQQKSYAAYRMYEIMRECGDGNKLVRDLWSSSRQLRDKPFHEIYVRAWLGREYLSEAANYDNQSAMVEYGLNCIGLGDSKSFAYRGSLCKAQNEEVALHWAEKMLLNGTDYSCMAGHIIYAEYYLSRCEKFDYDKEDLTLFCEHALEAKKYDIKGNNQYVSFYLAHIYADSKFKGYEDGKYFDFDRGRAIFEGLSYNATDPKIKRASEKQFCSLRGTSSRR